MPHQPRAWLRTWYWCVWYSTFKAATFLFSVRMWVYLYYLMPDIQGTEASMIMILKPRTTEGLGTPHDLIKVRLWEVNPNYYMGLFSYIHCIWIVMPHASYNITIQPWTRHCDRAGGEGGGVQNFFCTPHPHTITTSGSRLYLLTNTTHMLIVQRKRHSKLTKNIN